MNKDEIIQEFKKCKEDPVHFMSTYIKVTHPIRGLVTFDLYPFQRRIVREVDSNRFTILRKFRQAGCTTIAAAYSLWMAVFQKHKTIAIISKGDAESTELLERIKLMYDELPSFLKPDLIESNKHTLKLSTHSVIKSRPSGKQSGRSLAGSLLIVDEAAFIDNIDTIWAAVYPIISTGGRAFILSTVNGMGNWYYETYDGAIKKENAFNPIDISWREHPEYAYQEEYEDLYELMRSQEPPLEINDWEKNTKSNISLREWRQEYECTFLGTGETFIEGSILTNLTEEVDKEFYIKYNNRMRVWKDVKPQYEYLISVDVALGRDRDYSSFHVINMYNGNQVAEFYSNRTPINEFAEIIATEGKLYNNAYVIVERNTIGNNLIDWLINILEYENLWTDEKGEIGFQVNSKNREELLAGLEEALRVKMLKINSERTVNELLTFVFTETGKIEADSGKHDDLISSLSLAVFGLKNLMDTTPGEFTKVPHKDRQPMAPISIKNYPMKSHGGITEEDLRWLMN